MGHLLLGRAVDTGSLRLADGLSIRVLKNSLGDVPRRSWAALAAAGWAEVFLFAHEGACAAGPSSGRLHRLPFQGRARGQQFRLDPICRLQGTQTIPSSG